MLKHALKLGCGFAVLVLLATVTVQGQDFKAAKAEYRASKTKPALSARADAIETFAQSLHPEVVAELHERYNKPERLDFPDELRLIIPGCLSHFRHVPEANDFALEWLEELKPGKDPWLRYHLMSNLAAGAHEELVLEAVNNSKEDIYDRAAAIEALGTIGAISVLEWIKWSFLKQLPKKDFERRVFVNACASTLLRLKSQRESEAFVGAAEVLIDALGNKKIDDENKLVITRFLAVALNTENWGGNLQQWKNVLHKKEADAEHEGRTGVRTKPKFFGVVGQGDRVVYVIDVSASMHHKVDVSDMTELQKEEEHDGPVTGKGKEDARKKKDRKRKEDSGIPWSDVKNRLDLAKKCLVDSVLELEDHMTFAVVMFANQVDTLRATPRLIVASDKNIDKAVDEIKEIKLGILANGETEMHPGLRLAFKIHEKGLTKDGEQSMDVNAIMKGGNIFYVLSDGSPTNDSYTHSTERSQMGLQRGGPYTASNIMNPQSNPSRQAFFKRDIERLGFFRKPEIHCIGIAISEASWLNMLAEVGMGKVRLVGTAGK